MATSTVRVGVKTHKALREIAQRTGQSMQDVLARAVESYRREVFLRQANEAFAALRSDARAWEQEQAERAAWDATLGDGQE